MLPTGVVRTPAFMPVGTQGSVKALVHRDVLAAGAEIVRLAAERYGEAGGLPFSQVMQGVAAWKPRRRHPRSAE